MTAVLVTIVVLPMAATLIALLASPALGRRAIVAAAIASFFLSLVFISDTASGHVIHLGHWLRVDALSEVFLVSVTFLFALVAIYAVGYLATDVENAADTRYTRRFYAGLGVFAWSMVLAPVVDGLALLWVAIEITTVVSALLVAIDDTEGATEAAWKYVVLASMGLGIALLATVFMYYAGTKVFGNAYDLSFGPLLRGAHRFQPDVVRLAYVLAVLGYGTKMGLVPVHTWLPDAHSEAPTPVSALLSGSLLAVSFYAILRYYQLALRTLGPTFPQAVLLAFGIASLVLAALSVLRQRDLKRLLAYSSIEHMGILAVGVGFGVPAALFGVLLHVLSHTAAKGAAFFGAGSVVRKLHTKDMSQLRGILGPLPWSGSMLLLAVLALSAFPPFGIFRSEFQILAGGFSAPDYAAAAVLLVGVVVAFVGVSLSTTRILLTPAPVEQPRGEPSRWMVAPMLICLIALVVLGIHPPGDLLHLLHRAAADLGSSV